MPEWYDALGNPVPGPGPRLNARGQVPGSAGDTADQRLLTNPNLRTRENPNFEAPKQEGPGAGRRFLQGLGVPTSLEEMKAATGTALLNAATMGQYTPVSQAINSVQTGMSQGPVAGINTMNPVVPMMEAVGEENYAGAAGMATPWVLGAAGPLAPKIPGLNIRKARPGGTPIFADTVPAGPIRSGLQTLSKKLLPGAADDLVQPFLRPGQTVVGHKLYDEPIGPPAPSPLASDSLKAFEESLPNTPALPGAGRAPRPATPQAPVPVDMNTVSTNPPAMNFGQPTLGGTLPEPAPMPSPALRPGEDWFQPPADAVFGNAPRQPGGQLPLAPTAPAKKMSSDPTRLENRFEPFDQSSRATEGLTPGMNPRELTGAQGQLDQIGQSVQMGMDLNNPNLAAPPTPTVGFTTQSFNYLQNLLSKMDEGLDNILRQGEPVGTIPPGKYLQDHRTSQLAKIEAEKMGWDRENLHRPSASKGNRPVDAKQKLEIAATEKNAGILDKVGKGKK